MSEILILKVEPKAKKIVEELISTQLKGQAEFLKITDLEDLLLAKAIEEGDRGEYVDENEVFKALTE
ncbi:hypothetical protein [Thermodesulfatator atlanticus]